MHFRRYIALCSLALAAATGCADATEQPSYAPASMQTPALRAPIKPAYTPPISTPRTIPTPGTITEFSGYADCSHVRPEKRQEVIREDIRRIIREDVEDQGSNIYGNVEYSLSGSGLVEYTLYFRGPMDPDSAIRHILRTSKAMEEGICHQLPPVF